MFGRKVDEDPPVDSEPRAVADARAAWDRGDALFQTTLDLGQLSTWHGDVRYPRDDASALTAIAAIGWALQHAGWVSPAPASGVPTSGRIVGVYVFGRDS